MTKEHFIFEDKFEEIQNQFALKNGWLKIYESTTRSIDDSDGIYCCLVSNSHLDKYSENHDWPLHLGSEGKPSVYGDNTYRTNDEEGLEPFLFYKHFSLPENSVSYIDISEEFILYFKLYEKGYDKQNRVFYYIDDYGEMDEVIKVEPSLIKVRTKYLKEYVTIRDMNFVVCFDFMRLLTTVPPEWNIEHKDQTTKEASHIYNHLIRNVIGKTQSWMMGKVFIKPNNEKKTHFDYDHSEGESFIIGYDENGELKYQSCGDSDSAHFTLTYFKKEVLNKYYNDPSQYKVDGFGVSSKYFHLKIDNNVPEYVPVFLRDLRILSKKEQLHWKQYNIAPTDNIGISNTYYRTMIEGQWAETPETADLFFKSKYKDFNIKWEKKFGWKLYKPLSGKDEYLFTSLHQITTNNIKAFCEQTLTVVKLTIDRLNEKELVRGLELDSNIRGIAKFEKFLESKGMNIPDMFEFLRHLQNLRSGLIAHSFSESNKDCRNALDFFEIAGDNYIKVLENIFIKSVYTFNTLEKHFDLQ
jgi:hypothetical protein